MFTKPNGESPDAQSSLSTKLSELIKRARCAIGRPINELSYDDLEAFHRLSAGVERANELVEAVREEMKTIFVVRKIVDDFIQTGSVPSELKVPRAAKQELDAVRNTYLAAGHCEDCMRELHASLLGLYLKRPEDIFTFFSKVERVEINPYGTDIDDAVSRWIAGDPVPQILALTQEDIEKLGALASVVQRAREKRDSTTRRLADFTFEGTPEDMAAVRTSLEELKNQLNIGRE